MFSAVLVTALRSGDSMPSTVPELSVQCLMPASPHPCKVAPSDFPIGQMRKLSFHKVDGCLRPPTWLMAEP